MAHRPDGNTWRTLTWRTLFLALVTGAAFCGSPGAATGSDGPVSISDQERAVQESFRLVDEGGNSPTDLSIDPHIDSPQVGLDPTAIVTGHNVLALAFQQSAAARQLWFLFAGVGLGLLLFSAVLVRLAARSRTGTALLALWALAFSAFAYGHWTALDTVQQQRQVLIRLVQHAADQAAAPALLVPLTATLQPLSRASLAALHLCLDILFLGTLLLLWRHGRRNTS